MSANRKNASAVAAARGAAEALGRAIDEAKLSRERLVRGLTRRAPHAKKLRLAALLGQALRGETGSQR